jgi:hypothetical protein
LTTMILASRPTWLPPRQAPCSKAKPLTNPQPAGQKTSCYRACRPCGTTDVW